MANIAIANKAEILEDAKRLYIAEREDSVMSNTPFNPSEQLSRLMYKWAESVNHGKQNNDSNSCNT